MYTEISMYEKIFRNRSVVSNHVGEYIERIKFLMEKIEMCQFLIDNYNDISDEEFYEKIKLLGINSSLDSDDYRNILSLHYNKKYNGPLDIDTRMHEYIIEEEGYGKDLERHRVKSGVELTVVYTPKAIYKGHIYTKDEIKELLDNNSIVIIHKDNLDTAYLSSSEEWPNFEVALKDFWGNDKFEVKGEKYYDSTIKYIKKINNVDELRKTIESILKLLKEEINITDYLQQQFNDNRIQKRIKALETNNQKHRR